MYKNKTFLAIVPARANSKRLPNKNILNLADKPLVVWSIEAGLKSKYVDEVMVSTDSKIIADISKKYGATVPFLRPNNLSTDTATRSEVIKHVLNYYKNILDKRFDYIVFLQPTSPLRSETEIDKAIEYMFDKNGDSIVSVCEVEHPIHWSGTLPKDKSMGNFLDAVAIKSRSQDLPISYRLNGAIYICDYIKFLEEGCMFLKENIYAFIMKQELSIDIDEQLDFEIANFLKKRFLNEKK